MEDASAHPTRHLFSNRPHGLGVPPPLRVNKEKLKLVPRKAYWQTREAFRSSVGSLGLRRDSVEAESLYGEDSTESLVELSPRASVIRASEMEGQGRGSEGSLRNRLSLRR